MVKYHIKNFSSDNTRVTQSIQKKADEALMKTGKYFEAKVKEKLHREVYDRGLLASSVNTILAKHGLVKVGTPLLYGLVVEGDDATGYGRKPGTRPNMDAIAGWAGRKGITNGGRSYDNLSSEDKGTVFVIARKIKEKGILGKFIFYRTKEAEKENMINIFRQNFKNE